MKRWLLLCLLLLAVDARGNDLYTHGSFPAPGSPATSAGMRAELDLISAGFDKFPTFSGNANKAVIVNGSATAFTVTTGTLSLAGNFAISGAFATTLTVTGSTNVTLPTTGTLATVAGTETLTNKSVNLTSNTLTGTVAQFNTALSDGDFATLAGSESLSNKTIPSPVLSGTVTGTYTLGGTPTIAAPSISSPTLSGTPVIPDNVFTVGGSSDATKKVAFEVDGLTTGTTRTLTVPDASGTLALSGNAAYTWSTGDVKLTIKTTADTGWVLMNDGTIGSATSGATSRANADTQPLYELLWANCADAQCAVSSGRGASAAADFAANKTLALPKALGRALATYGTGSGLSARAMGQTTGSEDAVVVEHNHTISDPGHTHQIRSDNDVAGAAGGGNRHTDIGGFNSNTNTNTTGITINNAGVSGTGKNMQPTLFLNVMIKL